MNFSQLNSNEKMAAYAAVVVLITSIVSLVNAWGGLIVLPLLASIGMLLVLFQSSMMPTMKLPGSKGSLMLVAGGVAAIFWVIAALSWLDWIFNHLGTFDTLQFLLGLVASLVMGWTGWQAFQSEGGKFNVGMAGGSAAAAPSMAPPTQPAEPAPPAPPVAPAPMDEPMAPMDEPMGHDHPHEDES